MDNLKHYQIYTLGCKVNQCESAAIAASLADRGYTEGTDDAGPDLIVINTCAVTARAAMQSRQTIRQAVRRHPEAFIVATGCYAQIDPDALQAVTGVGLVAGHGYKLAVENWLTCCRAQGATTPALLWETDNGSRRFAPLASAAGEHRTRAFLKIQDGCDTRCSYCIVPLARGRSRSMPLRDVIAHMQRLGRQGFQEVVLTGIHLGAYGADFSPPLQLYDLVAQLAVLKPVTRMRLSSIEPTEIDPRLIRLISDPTAGLCHHLHLPLQSGDDTILEQMGRPYTRASFAGAVHTIHQILPRAAIGIDVLVGFPGEDDRAFENTCSLIEELPITYLHVFPYSVRPGTVAAGLRGRVPAPLIKARCQQLRHLGEQKRRLFHESQIGTCTTVLVESVPEQADGPALGTSDNYIPVSMRRSDVQANTLITVELSHLSAGGRRMVGRIE